MDLIPRARTACAALGAVALAAAVMGAGAATAVAAPSTLRVGCGHGAYPTIAAAVSGASSGDTIVVCPGTYAGGVVVGKTLSIVGIGDPVINATGQDNGVQVLASNSRLTGFTIENAIGEGVLVGMGPSPVSGVTISGNTVRNNDQGNPTGAAITSSPYAECDANPAAPSVPGDCGEGIHVVHASDNTVVGNTVTGNGGGILLSDDDGAAYGNLIELNHVSDNTEDCGITLAGHTPEVFGGGVHDNTIRDNSVTDNGVLGQGGGVLLASAVPGDVTGIPGTGGAVFDNVVENNYLAGNGLAGVTLHSHAPGEDLNGNAIIGNLIGKNNLAPDADFGPHYVDGQTTGVIVTAVSNVSITIEHNIIVGDVNGIWLGQVGSTITVTGGPANLFLAVTNPLVTVS